MIASATNRLSGPCLPLRVIRQATSHHRKTISKDIEGKKEIFMHSTSRFCAVALAAASLLVAPVLVVPAAQAQTQSPSAPPSTGQSPKSAPADISDNKLDAVAVAVKHVSALSDTFEKKLAQAPAADKERISAEAGQALAKAVTDQGLSVDEFTTIMEVAQKDPDVREKLMKRLKD
jgi:hypothetical protein